MLLGRRFRVCNFITLSDRAYSIHSRSSVFESILGDFAFLLARNDARSAGNG